MLVPVRRARLRVVLAPRLAAGKARGLIRNPETAASTGDRAGVGPGWDGPPTEPQSPPPKRRPTTWVVVVAASARVAYGTPPTSAFPGVKAVLLLGLTLSTPPAETQPVPSNRLTRTGRCRWS